MSNDKWRRRYEQQIEANNHLSDLLRAERKKYNDLLEQANAYIMRIKQEYKEKSGVITTAEKTDDLPGS